MMQSSTRLIIQFSRLSRRLNRLQHQEKVLQACGNCLRRAQCTMTSPHVEGTEKTYSPKIHGIVEDISKLNLLEVADLNELLKKTLKIQDAPVMAMGAAPAPAVKEEEEEEVAPKREKTSFNVKLTGFDEAKKVALIKEIKNISGLNLVQSKKFVESSPQVVKTDLTKEESEKLKETLEKVGGKVEVE